MKTLSILSLWLASCILSFGAGAINGVTYSAWNGVEISSWNGSGVSAAGGGGGGGGATFTDNFEVRTSNADLDGQSLWVAYTGHPHVVEARSGASTLTVRPATTIPGATYYNQTFSADQRAEILIGYVGSTGDWERIGAAVRIQSGADTYYDVVVETVYSATTVLVLRKVIAGTATVIQTSTTPIAAGDRIAIEASGTGSATRLKVQTNLASAGWTDIWTNQDPASTYIDGGRPGLSAYTQFGGSPLGNSVTVEEWTGADL